MFADADSAAHAAEHALDTDFVATLRNGITAMHEGKILMGLMPHTFKALVADNVTLVETHFPLTVTLSEGDDSCTPTVMKANDDGSRLAVVAVCEHGSSQEKHSVFVMTLHDLSLIHI